MVKYRFRRVQITGREIKKNIAREIEIPNGSVGITMTPYDLPARVIIRWLEPIVEATP